MAREEAKGGPNDALTRKVFAAEHSVAWVRVLVIALNVLVFYPFMDKTGAVMWLANLVTIVAWTYAMVVLAYRPYERFPVLTTVWFTSVTDSALITLWLTATGGFASPFYVLWYVSLAAIAFRYDYIRTMIAGAVYALVYLVLLALLGDVSGNEPAIVIRMAYILFVGMLGGLLSQHALRQESGRIQAEEVAESVRQSEARIRQVLQAAPDGFLLIHPDRTVRFANNTAQQVFGVPRGELVGRPVELFVQDDDRRRLQDAIAEALTTGTVEPRQVNLDLTGLRPDGRTFPMDTRITAVRIDNHRLATMVVQDVTAQQHARAMLEQQEERFRLLSEAAFEGLAIHDRGTILQTNKAFQRLFGYSPEEVQGIHTLELVAPESHEVVLDHLRTPDDAPYNVVCRRKDGSRFHARVQAKTLPFEDKKVRVVAIHDLTDRIEAEEAVARMRERTDLILDSAGEGIVGVDLNQVITFVNPAAERVLGASADSMVGRPVHGRLHAAGSDRESVPSKCATCRMFADRESHQVDDATLMRPNGTEFPASFTITPLMESERAVGAVMVFQDTTERRRTQHELRNRVEELARINAELEQFAYVSSHDLQEPLRMIASFVQMLKRKYSGKIDKQADEYIEFASEGARRMQELIEDLLQFSRVGNRARPFESVRLGDAASVAVGHLEREISESGAVVRIDELPEVMGDPYQLTQLFQNLIGNSLKFHGADPPEILVSSKRLSGHWAVTVKDNGIGIDPEFVHKVFVIFQRLQGRELYPGSGIGLAICRKIIDRHGGKIWVTSEGEGRGTEVHFTLPTKESFLKSELGNEHTDSLVHGEPRWVPWSGGSSEDLRPAP